MTGEANALHRVLLRRGLRRRSEQQPSVLARRLSDRKLFRPSHPGHPDFRGWWFIGVDDGEVWAFTGHTARLPMFEIVRADAEAREPRPAAPAPAPVRPLERLRVIIARERWTYQ